MKSVMKLVLAALLMSTVACSKDTVKVYHNNDRVTLLEARADLGDARDSMMSAQIASLEARMVAVENGVATLQSDLISYSAATDAAITDLQSADQDLAADIAELVAEVILLNNADVLLQSQLDDLSSRVSTLEHRLQGVEGSFPTLAARLNSMKNSINSLNTQVGALNIFAVAQTILNSYMQYQLQMLDNRIDNNSSDIQYLLSQVQSLTNTVNNFSSIYATQSSVNSSVLNLQNQIDSLLANSVTQQQLADAIAAIELLPGPQGPAGQDGTDGQNGAPGAQGPQGQPGINGSTAGMSAVKLCAADNATHPEYGFVVGDSIYAVYYGVVNGTLSAFLARLNAGSYVTTNDNTPCQFTVSYSDGNSYIDGVQVNPVIPPPVITPADTCSIVNQNNSSNSYLVTTSGTILNSSGKLEISLVSNAKITSHNYSGGGATASSNSVQASTGVYTFKPTAGVANSFLIYKSNNGTLGQSKVTDGNGNVITCTVTN